MLQCACHACWLNDPHDERFLWSPIGLPESHTASLCVRDLGDRVEVIAEHHLTENAP
jgi:hypothetical protein